MNRNLFTIWDADVTPREIGVSIIILFLMLSIGWLITNKIREFNRDKFIRIDTALKITDKDMYNHAVNTKVGDIIAYGKMTAKTPVKNEKINGEYLYLKIKEEHYVMKTRTVTYSCNCNSKGQCKTCTKTETYWEWDTYNTEEFNSDRLLFFDNEYDYNLFYDYPINYITTIKTSSHVRFKYYGAPKEFDTTFIANTSSGSIKSFDNKLIKLYPNMDIKKTIEANEINITIGVILFWLVWICVICGLLYGYVYLENKYLY